MTPCPADAAGHSTGRHSAIRSQPGRGAAGRAAYLVTLNATLVAVRNPSAEAVSV